MTVRASDGQEAEVYLDDGRRLGTTGQPLKIAPSAVHKGKFRADLVLKRKGFANTRSFVSVQAEGEQELTLPIVASIRHLELVSEPLFESIVGPAGVSGEDGQLTLDTAAEATRGGGVFAPVELKVELSRPGYLPLEVTLERSVWTEPSYPPAGAEPIILGAAPGFSNWFTRTRRERAWVLVLLGCLPVGLFLGWGKGREMARRLARARELDQLRADGSDPYLGTRLGGYRLAQVVGGGGMAIVYRGLPEETLAESEAVAVKVIRPEVSAEEGFMDRFYREVKVATSLVHPNIVSTYDWGEQDDVLYLVMELLNGKELSESVRPQMPVTEAVGLLIQAVEAAHHAHELGIVHRDLKPGNIMVCEGRVKVMDFGLARSHDAKTITATGNVLGTPAYLPPEQAKSLKADARSDQYSLGVLAFELLTGQRPFDAEEPISLIMLHVMEEAPAPQDVRPGLPNELNELVVKMLAKNPDERYSDLTGVLDVLRRYA